MKCGSPDTVANAMWPWRQRMGSAPAAPKRTSVTSIVIQTLVAGVVALLFLRKHHFVLAGVVATIAGALALCSVVWPSGYHGIQKAFQLLGLWLGRIMTYVLLAPCFFLIFAVAHLVFFLSRGNPLGYGFIREKSTYWEARTTVADPAKQLEVPY